MASAALLLASKLEAVPVTVEIVLKAAQQDWNRQRGEYEELVVRSPVSYAREEKVVLMTPIALWRSSPVNKR